MKKFTIILLITITHSTLAAIPSFLNTRITTLTVRNDDVLIKTTLFTNTGGSLPLCTLVDINPSTPNDIIIGGFLLENAHTRFNEIYSMALSAKLTDKEVKITFNNNAGEVCKVSQVELSE